MATPFSVEDVPPHAVDIVWPKMLPMVQRGLRHGEGDTITAEFIRAEAVAGRMRMWAVRDIHDNEVMAVVVFRILQNAKGRTLFIVMLAGRRLDDWADEVEQMLMDYRDIIGARCIRASCRLGLAEYLRKRGWKRSSVIMEAP